LWPKLSNLGNSMRSFAGGRLTFLKLFFASVDFSGCVWNFLKATGLFSRCRSQSWVMDSKAETVDFPAMYQNTSALFKFQFGLQHGTLECGERIRNS